MCIPFYPVIVEYSKVRTSVAIGVGVSYPMNHWTKNFAGVVLVLMPGLFAISIGALCVHGYVYGDTIKFGLLALLLVIQASWYAGFGIIASAVVMIFAPQGVAPKGKWTKYTIAYSSACLMYTLMPALAVGLSYHKANQESKDQYNKDFPDQLDAITTDLSAYAKFLANCVLGIVTESIVTMVSFQYWSKMDGAQMAKVASGGSG